MGGSYALLAFCTAGIYVAYLTQGLAQENLSTTKYEPDGAKFSAIIFLNFAQSVACAIYSGIVMVIFHRGKKGDSAPWYAYWKASITNSVGPACGVAALKNISYPAQVLAKSCKMIPVMIVGTIIGGKRYSLVEYMCVSMIVAGISIFALFKSSAAALSKLASPNVALGYSLCLANLIFDGYTNAAQDKMKEKYKATSANELMFYMNIWCSLYSAIYMFGISSVGSEALSFLAAHPRALLDMALFCACGAFGQQFIFLTIASFGSLVNTTITTTRKFVNILLSVVVNGTALMPLQWVGVALVFGGLTLKEVYKSKSTPVKKLKE
eukprot:CAMPEP_0197861196 /NCGR_PEP_ID=MMETSP1438-20131217/37087_1 /TAXON_ID=1461541 /ORGANISM="Pterosperma sp., Strain CCMP1384" /LENGTH=323 /DNA_ID=CAMNT_0043478293 /DNA_START=87 /DNA_END=1058 /DNA_ORIENTATION=+